MTSREGHPGKAVAASGGDDQVADGVADEVGYGMQVEFEHDVGPKIRAAREPLQDLGQFVKRTALQRRGQAIPFAVALASGSVNQVGGGEHTQGPLVIDGAEDGAESGRFQ